MQMQNGNNTKALTKRMFVTALDDLRRRHEHIESVISKYGPPPMWAREPGFPSLVFTILEQQVSLASARAVYERLCGITGLLTPEAFIRQTDAALREIGFSRQKTQYCRNVATSVLNGQLNLDELEQSDDGTVRARLMEIKGIGGWTSDIYLLHSLCRPDIWPTGDLALRVSVLEVLALQTAPSENELLDLGENYRPWRSVATRVFWHHYLTIRNRALD